MPLVQCAGEGSSLGVSREAALAAAATTAAAAAATTTDAQQPRSAATRSHQEPPGDAEDAVEAASKCLVQDQVFSLLALALWIVTSVKSFLMSSLLAVHNLQSLLGAAAIFGVGLAWPLAAPRSYLRCRVPALAAVRVLLLTLPYNFEEGIWDEVFPGSDSGPPLSPLIDLCHLAVGSGLVLLVLTALGWRLPIRVHMVLQAAMVGTWIHFGTGPHCRNQLMRSPAVAPAVSAVYTSGELGIAVLVPLVAHTPGGPRTQAAAFLLFMWLLCGWLLPTLLLLHPIKHLAQQPRGSGSGRRQLNGSSSSSSRAKRCLAAVGTALVWLEGRLLAGLHSMIGAPPVAAGQQQQQQQDGDADAEGEAAAEVTEGAIPLATQWVFLLLLMWMVCRTVAPLYAEEAAVPIISV